MADIDRTKAQIEALNEAAVAVTGELGLENVLNRLAEIAARLINARYAALGVPDGRGGFAQFLAFGMSHNDVARMDHYPLGLGLLGELLRDTQPIRLESLKDDPRSAPFCQYHPIMTTFLGVPIMSKGKHLGSLYLCDRNDGLPFTEEDENLITLLAAHAATAIENAQLSQKLQTLAVVEERDRISMELHDGIIQSIYGIGMQLELARLKLDRDSEVSTDIYVANQSLNQVIEDLRNYIQNLKIGLDLSLSLQEKLAEVASGFRQVSTARLEMNIARGFTGLTEERVHAIVQIAREALSNAVRHAHATEVTLDLYESSSNITLVVNDDGQGFDTKTVHRGNGLNNIAHRAERLGGKADFASGPAHGTKLTVIIPINKH